MPNGNTQTDIAGMPQDSTNSDFDVLDIKNVRLENGTLIIDGKKITDDQLNTFNPGDGIPLPPWLSRSQFPYDNSNEPYENVIFIGNRKIPISGSNDAQDIYNARGAIERNSPPNDGIMNPQKGAKILSKKIRDLSASPETYTTGSRTYQFRDIYGAFLKQNENIEKRNRKFGRGEYNASREAYFHVEDFFSNLFEQNKSLTEDAINNLYYTKLIKPSASIQTAIENRIKKGQARKHDKENLEFIKALRNNSESFYENALQKKIGEGSIVYLHNLRYNPLERESPEKQLCKAENAYSLFGTHPELKNKKGSHIYGTEKSKPHPIGIDLPASILECLYLEGQNSKTNIIDAFLKTESYKDVEGAINKLKSMKMISSKSEEIKITPLGRSAYEDTAIRAIEEVKDKGIYNNLKSKAIIYGITASPRNKNISEDMPNKPVTSHRSHVETDNYRYDPTKSYKPGPNDMVDTNHHSGMIFNLAHSPHMIR